MAGVDGKYYGTKVVDATGIEVVNFWQSTRDDGGVYPCSSRWLAQYGPDYDPSDSHFESQRAYDAALAFVALFGGVE